MGSIKALSGWCAARANFSEKDTSPDFWPGGAMRASAQFERLPIESGREYRLSEGEQRERITEYFCIQRLVGFWQWTDVRIAEVRYCAAMRMIVDSSSSNVSTTSSSLRF